MRTQPLAVFGIENCFTDGLPLRLLQKLFTALNEFTTLIYLTRFLSCFSVKNLRSDFQEHYLLAQPGTLPCSVTGFGDCIFFSLYQYFLRK